MARIGIAMMLAALVACGGQGASPEAGTTAPNAPVTSPDATTPVPTGADTDPEATAVPSSVESERPRADAPALCSGAEVAVTGAVENNALGEASGLVASRTHPGVLWSHNDGGARPGIFALGLDGSDLGFHPLSVEVVDVEDMAIAGGATGDDIYLGDIGDNGEERRSIAVLRFPEPDPAAPGEIAVVERFEFSYPDRPHNAETLLVDDVNDVIVIVTKEQEDGLDGAPDPLGGTETSYVFEGRLDVPGPAELVPVGTIDTTLLEARVDDPLPHPSSLLGFGGVPTGGDVSADGTLVALRTYEAIWLWPRQDGQRVSDAFRAQPCAVASAGEIQGEAIAFAGEALVTLGEGVGQPIHRIAR
jgi:hypothetical protein